jgi:putative ABC transport system permease protein
MRSLNQILAITLMNLQNLPQRIGTSLVVVVGIAGVVGVLVSVLAMSEGFRYTLAATRRSCWPRCPGWPATRAGGRRPRRSSW